MMTDTQQLLIIGLGNPIVADDAIGIHVARLLQLEFENHPRVTVTEAYAGGIRLMERMVGYETVIIIDAMTTGECEPGTIRHLHLNDLMQTRNVTSTHDTPLPLALDLAALTGQRIPDTVLIWGIEASDVTTFTESLTPAVQQSVPKVVHEILVSIRSLLNQQETTCSAAKGGNL